MENSPLPLNHWKKPPEDVAAGQLIDVEGKRASDTADQLYKLYGEQSAIVVLLAYPAPEPNQAHDLFRWSWRGPCLTVEGLIRHFGAKSTWDAEAFSAGCESAYALQDSFGGTEATVVVMIGVDGDPPKVASIYECISVGKHLKIKGLISRSTPLILDSMWKKP